MSISYLKSKFGIIVNNVTDDDCCVFCGRQLPIELPGRSFFLGCVCDGWRDDVLIKEPDVNYAFLEIHWRDIDARLATMDKKPDEK